MNILITGIAGFIGSHLAERLIAEGHKVCGIDCFTPTYTRTLKCLNADALRAQGVNIWSLDLAVDDLHAAVRDVDVVYHLAAQPGLSATTAIDDYIRNNIIATQRLLEAVSAVDTVYAFINISTSSVYGMNATGDEASEPKPISSYGVTKLAAEQFVLARTRSTQFPTCSLRLFSVYGPRERPDKLFFRVIA